MTNERFGRTGVRTAGPAFASLLEEQAKIRGMAEEITHKVKGAFLDLSELDIDAGTVAFNCRYLHHELRAGLVPYIKSSERSPRAVEAYDGIGAVAEAATGYDDMLDAIVELRELMATFGEPPPDRRLDHEDEVFFADLDEDDEAGDLRAVEDDAD